MTTRNRILNLLTLLLIAIGYIVFSILQYRHGATDFSPVNIPPPSRELDSPVSTPPVTFPVLFDIAANVLVPSDALDNSLALEISRVFYITTPPDFPTEYAGPRPDTICIDKLLLGIIRPFAVLDYEMLRDPSGPVQGYVSFPDTSNLIADQAPVCSQIDDFVGVLFDASNSDENDTIVSYLVSTNYFLYPLDDLEATAAAQISYYLTSGGTVIDKQTAAPSFSLNQQDTFTWEWNVEEPHFEILGWTDADSNRMHDNDLARTLIDDEQLLPLDLGPYSSLKLHVVRPLSVQFAYGFFVFGIVIFIFLLPNIEDTGTFAEISLTILFGMYGLKQFLIPANLQNVRTILDVILTGLYTLFGVAVLLFVSRQTVRHLQQIQPQQHAIRRKFRRLFPGQREVLASIDSPIFHIHTCQHANMIADHKRLLFRSAHDAMASQRRPCKDCLPNTALADDR